MDSTPIGKSSASLISIEKGKFMLLGGCNRDLEVDSVFELEVGDTLKWKDLGSAEFCNRFGCLAWKTDKVYVHGGQDKAATNHMDLFSFSKVKEAKNHIIQPVDPAKYPPVRSSHAGCLVGEDMHFFGGAGGNELRGDYWIYKAKEDLFVRVETEVEPREMHGMAEYKGKVFIIGGRGVSDVFDEVIVLEEGKITEKVVMFKKVCCFGYFKTGKYLVIVGGTDGLSFYESIWLFNLETYEWRQSKFKLNQPKIGVAAACDSETAILFGGSTLTEETNDTQLIKLAELTDSSNMI